MKNCASAKSSSAFRLKYECTESWYLSLAVEVREMAFLPFQYYLAVFLQKSKFYEISYAIRATPVLIFTFIMQGKLTMR